MPDFQRDVRCILGLPFDMVDLAGAAGRVRQAVHDRQSCVVSTPNLNFVVAAQRDAKFRDSVLHSDLSLADGMPLVWVARLMGLPLPERVAGASLYERLRDAVAVPIRVFFFGGPDGVAGQACERLNAQGAGLRCVGYDSPGFVPVEAMSEPERIARINASAADFVMVSLGAVKGQAWIEHNRARLTAPVVSHLGAVVNFAAGSVQRAPSWMQRSGLEWLWRVKEEPALWRRYWHDGLGFVRLLVTRVLPYRWHARRDAPGAALLAAARVAQGEDGDTLVLTLRGAWTADNDAALRPALAAVAPLAQPLVLDVREVSHVDPSVVALWSLLWASRREQHLPLRIVGAAANVRRSLTLLCADYLLGEERAA